MFYHVSIEDLGRKFVFEPRVPKSSLIKKEGNIPRVCVAPNVFYCMRAIASMSILDTNEFIGCCKKINGKFHYPAVYQTEEYPLIPPDSVDFRHNCEGWFIKPIELKRIGYIDLLSLLSGEIKIQAKKGKLQNELQSTGIRISPPKDDKKYRKNQFLY